MKYSVNDRCIGCALCCDACPEVFVMTGEGVATVHDQPEDGVVTIDRRQLLWLLEGLSPVQPKAHPAQQCFM